MQITDYINGLKIVIFLARIAKQRLMALKLLTCVPRKKPRKSGQKKDILKQFYRITHFIKKGYLPTVKPAYIRRFRDVSVLSESDITFEGISKVEILMLKGLDGFKGFFEHVIHCNDFAYFDDLQLNLENEGITLRNRFLRDVIIHELARIQIGLDTYNSYMNAILFMQPAFLKSVLHDPYYFPDVKAVSHILRAIPLAALHAYFYNLLEESHQYGIVKYRILVWDCQFVHSNSSDQFDREKGSYNDPDAGFCRHNGTIYGVGYKASTIYAFCGNRYIPVYCELFPGNQDEYSVFRATFEHFFALGHEKPLVVLTDAGPYSLDNLIFLFNLGIVPLINARSNIKHQNILKLNKYFYVNKDFIPDDWTKEELISLMNIRSGIEREFSHIVVVYHAKRANVRGIEMVSKHRFLILILDLLKINTAFKVGRPDLIGECRVFNTTKHVNFDSFFPPLARKEGYLPLLPE